MIRYTCFHRSEHITDAENPHSRLQISSRNPRIFSFCSSYSSAIETVNKYPGSSTVKPYFRIVISFNFWFDIISPYLQLNRTFSTVKEACIQYSFLIFSWIRLNAFLSSIGRNGCTKYPSTPRSIACFACWKSSSFVIIITRNSRPSVRNFLKRFNPFIRGSPMSMITRFGCITVIISYADCPFPAIPANS